MYGVYFQIMHYFKIANIILRFEIGIQVSYTYKENRIIFDA